MNVNPITNSPSFGSIYKFNIVPKDREKTPDVIDILYFFDTDNESYKITSSFPKHNRSNRDNAIKEMHICADDKYDKFIESTLKQRNIGFIKQSKAEALEPENIYKRIILPEHDYDRALVALDTKKVDELLKEERNFYVSKNAQESGIPRRYNAVKEFLATGNEIEAPQATLFVHKGKLILSITDGCHRFAVMRDLGMKKVKFSLDANSVYLAEKYHLIAK